MAGISASAMGVPMETITEGGERVQGGQHRIEFVLERSGVKYYNDYQGN